MSHYVVTTFMKLSCMVAFAHSQKLEQQILRVFQGTEYSNLKKSKSHTEMFYLYPRPMEPLKRLSQNAGFISPST